MRLLTALCASVLALGGVVAAAAPSYAAGTCGSPAPLTGGPGVAVGTGSVNASHTVDVWSMAALQGTYSVSLTSLSGLYLTVTGTDCGTTYCAGYAALVLPTCTIHASSPGTFLVNVFYVTSGLVADSPYTVSVVGQSGLAGPGCTNVAGVTACASYTATTPFQTLAVNAPGSTPTNVAGEIDAYAFTLPNGGVLTLPCLVIGTTDPCADAGATYVSTFTTLSQTVDVPTAALTTPVTTVRVCNANLVLTVDEFGVNSFPAYTVC